MPESHSGKTLARTTYEVLKDFGITDKVSALDLFTIFKPCLPFICACAQLLALGGDGASVNNKLAEELKKLMPAWGGLGSRV